MKEREKLQNFKQAKQLAFSLPNNMMKRPNSKNPYMAAHINNEYWVIADNTEYLKYPDAVTEDGRPMRRVHE